MVENKIYANIIKNKLSLLKIVCSERERGIKASEIQNGAFVSRHSVCWFFCLLSIIIIILPPLPGNSFRMRPPIEQIYLSTFAQQIEQNGGCPGLIMNA